MPRTIGLLALALLGCGGAHGIAKGGIPIKPATCSLAEKSFDPVATPVAGSTLALENEGGKTIAYVADEDTGSILVVDVEAKTVRESVALGATPSQVILSANALYVALRDRASVVAFQKKDGKLVQACTCATPTEPISLAYSSRHKELYVASGWGRKVSGFSAETLAPAFETSVAREPRALMPARDDEALFVAHAVGGAVSVLDRATHQVVSSKIRARDDARFGRPQNAAFKLRAIATEEETRGERDTSCQAFALAKVEGRILSPSVLVDRGDLLNRPEGYGENHEATEVPAIAVLDEATGEPLPASVQRRSAWVRFANSRDEPGKECLLPRATAVHQASKSLLVACAGSDELVSHDAYAANPERAVKGRWNVGAGPTGVAVNVKGRAIVWSQFDRTLSVVDVNAELAADRSVGAPISRIALGTPRGKDTAFLLGRILFHASGDQRISRDGRACASCHPDGRDDAITWATPEGPRRTIMLAGRLEGTAPYSWSNSKATLRDHLESTFDRLGGAGGLRSLELDALVHYIETMAPPPSMPEASEKVRRGKEVFASPEAGCQSCHPVGSLTDGVGHDVGSRAPADRSQAFNTPTLRFVGGTGPYFHDGRYASLRALFLASDHTMGKTRDLSRADLEALEAYVRSL